jgi:hypothetical protein
VKHVVSHNETKVAWLEFLERMEYMGIKGKNLMVILSSHKKIMREDFVPNYALGKKVLLTKKVGLKTSGGITNCYNNFIG